MPSTIHERLASYRKARRFSIDDCKRALSRQEALTADGHPFRAEHWEALEAGSKPILQTDAVCIAKVFALSLDQLAAVLTGTNEVEFIPENPKQVSDGSTFAQCLIAARRRAQLTQGELAAKAKMAQSYLCLLERREKAPTFQVLRRVAAGLGVSWEKLVPAHLLAEYKLKHVTPADDDLNDVLY